MIKKLTAKAVDEDPAGCPGGGEGTPFDGLLQSSGLHERVGISFVKVYKRVFKRAQKGFMENVLFLWLISTVWHQISSLRILIFAIFPAIRKKKFQQIKITANIFPAKIYCIVNIL